MADWSDSQAYRTRHVYTLQSIELQLRRESDYYVIWTKKRLQQSASPLQSIGPGLRFRVASKQSEDGIWTRNFDREAIAWPPCLIGTNAKRVRPSQREWGRLRGQLGTSAPTTPPLTVWALWPSTGRVMF
eukprot:4203988-Pleurochrysis_carterae.AAC.2